MSTFLLAQPHLGRWFWNIVFTGEHLIADDWTVLLLAGRCFSAWIDPRAVLQLDLGGGRRSSNRRTIATSLSRLGKQSDRFCGCFVANPLLED